MHKPFDLAVFSDNLGGDMGMVSVLLGLFIETADGVFLSLDVPPDQMSDSNYTQHWRQQLHLLRGSSLNIGADLLSRYAEIAELNAEQLSVAEKRLSLEELKRHYDQVKSYIASIQNLSDDS